MKVFGCTCYSKVPDGQRKKWDPKAKKVIFVGYSSTPNNYRVYDPAAERIFVTTNVKFNESDCDVEKVIKQINDGDDVDEDDLFNGYDGGNSDKGDNDTNDKDDDSSSEITEIIDDPPKNENWDNLINAVLLQATVTNCEPLTFDDALNCEDKDNWFNAMTEEMKSIKENKTYLLTKLPPGKRLIQFRWVFRVKRKTDGTINRYKARLVAKGFS